MTTIPNCPLARTAAVPVTVSCGGNEKSSRSDARLLPHHRRSGHRASQTADCDRIAASFTGMTTDGTAGELPLSDVRVIDLTDGKAELTTRSLGDLGAMSHRIALPQCDTRDAAIRNATHNANKRILPADVTAPDGRAQLHRLLATADILVKELAARTAGLARHRTGCSALGLPAARCRFSDRLRADRALSRLGRRTGCTSPLEACCPARESRDYRRCCRPVRWPSKPRRFKPRGQRSSPISTD